MATVLKFQPRPTTAIPTPLAIPAPAACACCLGRPGVGVFREVWTCAACARHLDRRAIGVVQEEGFWVYEAKTRAAERHLAGGWRLFDRRRDGLTALPAC